MPWKECHVEDERLRFIARLLDGETMTALCAEFGISRKTGYKIYDRYKEVGVRGLTDRSRRPYRHANQLPMQIEKTIVRLKREYPSWGAPKIRERLRHRCPDVQCPAISTVHAVLDRHGLVTRRKRRRYRAEGTSLSHPGQPNDLWCADYKGEFMLADRRYCYPLTVTDFASRYLITCDALSTTKEMYAFTVFERTFKDFDEFWGISALGSSVGPTLAAMPAGDVEVLKSRVRARLPADPAGRITFGARANAIKGRMPE